MKFQYINLIVFLLFGGLIAGCNSGEYELEQTQVEYIEKTLKYDTIKTLVRDTAIDNQDLLNEKNRLKETFTFIVQIGAFREPDNFQRFFDAAKLNLGEEVYYVVINNLYKIRIGSYKNKADALQMLDKVKSLGYFDAFVITVINKQ